jgi:DNA-binding transcriptional regulator YdaS (Cro superfamily)
MSLHTYISGLDKAALEGFAKRCLTSVGQLKQVAYGNRRASAGLAVGIERETGAVITCEQLRSDIDWAYVRSTGLHQQAA